MVLRALNSKFKGFWLACRCYFLAINRLQSRAKVCSLAIFFCKPITNRTFRLEKMGKRLYTMPVALKYRQFGDHS